METLIITLVVIALLLFRKAISVWLSVATNKSENLGKLIEKQDMVTFSKQAQKVLNKAAELDRLYDASDLDKEWKALSKLKRTKSEE